MKNTNIFSISAKKHITTDIGKFQYYSLHTISDSGLIDLEKTPYSIRVLLENVLRNSAYGPTSDTDIELVASWRPNSTIPQEFPYMPKRVLLQDFTGVPVIVDLAAMRDAVTKYGIPPTRINPVIATDMVVDHSVQVDYFGSEDALTRNINREFKRNIERYSFLKWAQSFNNLRIIPPGVGIVHQVNLEYLASVVIASGYDEPLLCPDTCIGTDSHTTMVNGLGVLAWGVGGIEAEVVMLGQPYYMLIPEVVGVRLVGQMPQEATATDLVLTVTEKLRQLGVVDKFVEFFGPGLNKLSVADRATIANMAPEYGATCSYFPIDEKTVDYLVSTGRSLKDATIVERYAKENALWHDNSVFPSYSQEVAIDLSSVVPSVAGPKRPQDRLDLREVSADFYKRFPKPKEADIAVNGENVSISDGAVVIAAITSCTNTSNPSAMVGAGLLAKNAVDKGLTVKPWVKTSMAPGSRVVTDYLNLAGLDEYLQKLGFHTVGYGCTTCIGNSGPLPSAVATAVEQEGLRVAGVLSGNRNFEGRIHPQVVANYLASPMLVVAYAIMGHIGDIVNEPLGYSDTRTPILLKDIWPSYEIIQKTVANCVKLSMFEEQYAKADAGTEQWQNILVTKSDLFKWDKGSTYIQKPPYFDDFTKTPSPIASINNARVLVFLSDSVTTDHISPAGSIPPSTPAGQYLIGNDIPRREFNTYGTRRGNHNVMMRGTFGNIRLRNILTPDMEGDWTIHIPSNEKMRIFDAAMRYKKEGTPLIVIAGKEYGTGSSRDWAAKGPMLLGVRAVIAQTYERIHRSNLVGMGVLPLQFTEGQSAQTLGLTGKESFNIVDLHKSLTPRATINITAQDDTSEQQKSFSVTSRLDTDIDVEYYKHGGILPYVLRQIIDAESSTC